MCAAPRAEQRRGAPRGRGVVAGGARPGAQRPAARSGRLRGSSRHPLLRPAVVDTLSLGSFDAATDESGHGTMVASLALYGSLEGRLRARQPISAAGRVLSIRVLDHDNLFPTTGSGRRTYPRWLLGLDGCALVPAARAGLASPAMAALALTVGATVGAAQQGVRVT